MNEVCAAMGMSVRELFPSRDADGGVAAAPLAASASRPKPRRTYGTAQAAIAAIAEPNGWETAGEWLYEHADGSESFRVVRFALPHRGKGYRPLHRADEGWVVADPPGLLPLYRLPDLAEAETVWVVEGEKCADGLRQ